MIEKCKWIHQQLEQLPLIKYPFDINKLPDNGIYFFYENGEIWGHGGNKPRIVRVGTHKDGNFKSRIKGHYLLNETRMNFNSLVPPPHDTSIFRKNIGRVLLNMAGDEYLKIWDMDFIKKTDRIKNAHLRDIDKEKKIESEVSRILRENFSFRFIIIENQQNRMGSAGLESCLIGTIASCTYCKPSENWLGKYSPVDKIRESGLWQVQHLRASNITDEEMEFLIKSIKKTKNVYS
ncbi:MAG: hypothetical protein M1371_10250 [Actinobacteria bacterium]|nr:hypothetical protein [Actinomycetota bacterium]MCL5986923.1 hypothetical protein [Actinomycetota bacterium]